MPVPSSDAELSFVMGTTVGVGAGADGCLAGSSSHGFVFFFLLGFFIGVRVCVVVVHGGNGFADHSFDGGDVEF